MNPPRPSAVDCRGTGAHGRIVDAASNPRARRVLRRTADRRPSTRFRRTGIALGLAWVAVVTMAQIAMADGHASGVETRAKLNSVVLSHVRDLLADRFDPAWARIHPTDRRAVGRDLWESCKQSSGGALTEVKYVSVGIILVRPARFSSRLHERISSVAVAVEVRALVSGVPVGVRDVSHWIRAKGRWYRIVEQRKLAAYSRGRCPA
jgi:hypothetical protein